ncbi:DUF423 domain-containing protein [Cellulophaga lytica]|uniref:DUF423 domain-containing protein n=1 Tax=Cellulophaga lytica (strain ATCC 23178 / DSM 7489 / JCM 8516 / NBRC 14961 / NCIMB 1423 / VKM B-1433 / Cy l20) TaxID=867900 RepID=F0RAW0_CELLC|nr:DUF423 domain-containing protein [Cellulophaga lytica]ADY29516.1 protein of unknown function DUF423 [Cellulophaga lytica DSM 7489]APU10398.1 hypothetical protein A5M85_08910 [Cellulophaga lytica]MDO6852305.1 DUF423 domain-containing protein [Cellulophaga lytica]WQG76310.1 DUF423 domain-containing protein [Cellulophaga lytica]
MIITIKVFGALYGMLAVIFGAFGAHALKKIFTDDQLKNFETGVKYQMYHAIVLLVLGFNYSFSSTIEVVMGYAFVIGIFLFSFSIYGLCISSAKGKKMKFLGPITPLGGLGLVLGWALLLITFLQA